MKTTLELLTDLVALIGDAQDIHLAIDKGGFGMLGVAASAMHALRDYRNVAGHANELVKSGQAIELSPEEAVQLRDAVVARFKLKPEDSALTDKILRFVREAAEAAAVAGDLYVDLKARFAPTVQKTTGVGPGGPAPFPTDSANAESNAPLPNLNTPVK